MRCIVSQSQCKLLQVASGINDGSDHSSLMRLDLTSAFILKSCRDTSMNN